jgi:hypothetical protein
VAKDKSCCNLDAKPTATVAQGVKFTAGSDWRVLDSVAPHVCDLSTLREAAGQIAYCNTGPPEFDRVITLRRLLI